jgi:hypothetical protein
MVMMVRTIFVDAPPHPRCPTGAWRVDERVNEVALTA